MNILVKKILIKEMHASGHTDSQDIEKAGQKHTHPLNQRRK